MLPVLFCLSFFESTAQDNYEIQIYNANRILNQTGKHLHGFQILFNTVLSAIK